MVEKKISSAISLVTTKLSDVDIKNYLFFKIATTEIPGNKKVTFIGIFNNWKELKSEY